MEFNEKLQELRKQKNLTQEELAEVLFVSRTAVSKWESGRGYPNIESLKLIAKYFNITIDELLSGNELLVIAEKDNQQKENLYCDLLFGLLDLSVLVLLFIPCFGQKFDGVIQEVSLLLLTEISPWLLILYFVLISLILMSGVITLALQNCNFRPWVSNKRKISIILNILGVLLFIISLQPYAATLLLVFLIVKVMMLIKKQ